MICMNWRLAWSLRVRRGLTTLAALALLGLAACGERSQEETSAPTAAPPAEQQAGPAIWTVKDDDSEITLFGTFHLLPPGLDWQRPAMRAAFDRASLLMLEADVSGGSPDQLMALIREHGVADKGVTVRSRMSSPEAVARYEGLVASLGLTPEQLDEYEPWYAATILTVAFAQSQGFTSEAGVEAHLTRLADEQGKARAYFETLEQQILFFATLPEASQIKMLGATVDELDAAANLIKDMQAAWLKGDTARMGELFDASVRAVPELHKVLIADRNSAWTDEIERRLAGSGTIFIAVGAGHLVGADSVVAQLRAKGHDVTGP